jgi:hypothetical protein
MERVSVSAVACLKRLDAGSQNGWSVCSDPALLANFDEDVYRTLGAR